ncbi:UNVERIFIED_CONTAM: hypothetical protein FKN15_010501 [Acipenser sinensis]
MAPRSQKFSAFLDFMEEVLSSWDCPASAPSVLKQAAHLAFLEGADKLGLAGFPPVDSTIAALVKVPLVGGLAKDPACPTRRLTETHLKRAYAAEAQLWLSQARVPDADKAVLLDAPISPGHTFGPAVEEILQSSHQEHRAPRQVAALLHPSTPAWGRSNLRCVPITSSEEDCSEWSLDVVLEALRKAQLEPIHSIELKYLSMKTAFLVAITSAKRVSELQALSVHSSCMRIRDDGSKVSLRTNPDFIPKVITAFHINPSVELESSLESAVMTHKQ